MANLLLIRKFAKERNITIRELANRVGIGEAALQALIKNGSTSTTTLEKIAKELEVSAGIFFDKYTVSTGDVSNNTNSPIGSTTIGDNNFNNHATTQDVQGFVDVLKIYQEQTGKLLSIIEKLSEKYGK